MRKLSERQQAPLNCTNLLMASRMTMPRGMANNTARSRPSSIEIRPISTAADDEQRKDVLQPPLEVALVENLDQEEHQAADQHHDQRRADGDDQVIDQRFVEPAGHGS